MSTDERKVHSSTLIAKQDTKRTRSPSKPIEPLAPSAQVLVTSPIVGH
ncbi:MAG: hypothetical protein ACXWWL_01105 [Candidatus Limnocylindria bacterium]